MSKTWLVMRNEIVSNVSRRSWLVVTFGLPLVLVLVLFGGRALRSAPAPTGGGVDAPGQTFEMAVEGYVDHSGLIRHVPQGLEGKLIAYDSEAQAREALQVGEIAAYYVIPAEYLQQGDVLYVSPDFKGFSPKGQSWAIVRTLLLNMLGGNAQLMEQVWEPMVLNTTALPGASERQVDSEGPSYWVPYATAMILYVVLIMSASLLRSSMGNERKTRVMEVMMLSVRPRQILAGKIVGLAIVGLLQTLIWVGTGYFLLRLGGQTLRLPAGTAMPVSVVAWAAVFFVLGYAVYASLLAGLGALAGPNVMGSSTADFVIIWPLIIPIFFQMVVIQTPNTPLAVALSLVPFTAPVAMMTRLAAGGIPWWQPWLSAGLMAVTAVVVVRAVARLFRAQYLLSGQDVTTKQYLRLLLSPSSET